MKFPLTCFCVCVLFTSEMLVGPNDPLDDIPTAMGQTRSLGPSLGPQLMIDESGNLQLNAASLFRDIDDEHPVEESPTHPKKVTLIDLFEVFRAGECFRNIQRKKLCRMH